MTARAPRLSKAGSLLVVLGAYLAALAAAAGVVLGLDDVHPLWAAAAADLAATGVVFCFSLLLDNSSVYDPYWSVVPVPVVIWWALRPEAAGADTVRQGLVIGLVCLWGARLTWNWCRRWEGLRHEDWRYAGFRASCGKWYWPVSLLGIHLFPTAIVFACLMPLYPALVTGTRPFGPLDVAASAVALGAILIETVADRQLARFLRSGPEPGTTLSEGLWAWSRHPNYFGEVSFWWGLFLFAPAADPAWWPAAAAPAAMTALFVFISVPMIDRRMHARRPGYAERMKTTSALLPLPPRRRING